MATFKAVVIPAQRRQDGTYNVKIRVTHQRKSRYLSTPFYVTSEQLTRGFKIKDMRICDKLDERIAEFRHNADELGFLADGMDIDHLVELLQNRAESIDFIAFMENYCKRLEKEEGRGRSSETFMVAVRSLKRFNNNRPLYFSAITKTYMYRYWDSISHLKPNTKISYITAIKSMYRRAQKELNNDDTGQIIVRHGVFDLIEVPREEAATELAFETVEQMQAVIDSPYTGTWIFDFAKDMFVFSFVCFGVNLADIVRFRKDDYKDGVLTYRRKKVSRRLGHGAEMKIKVPEVGRIIIEKYNGDPEWLIDFRGHSRKVRVARCIHATFQIAGVEPKGDYLSRTGHYKGKYVFYTARHSMATYARNVCHIDKVTVHEMLNHATPQDMRTTDVYLRRDYSHLWEANEKLMALFDWGFYEKQKKGDSAVTAPLI